MHVIGVDVTSAPSRTKPLVLAHGVVEPGRGVVQLSEVVVAQDFAPLEAALATPGPWLMAMDSCFGLPLGLVVRLGWPRCWVGYVAAAAALDRAAYRARMLADQAVHPPGQKYLYRENDRRARSASPSNVQRPPMGLMFHAVAPRLLAAHRAGVAVLPMAPVAGADRVVVEAYPALVARALLHDPAYKDGARSQAHRRAANRAALVEAVLGPSAAASYGLRLSGVEQDLATALVSDRSADRLDALLALLQAGWAWTARTRGYGLPAAGEAAQEGWITDPVMDLNPHTTDTQC